MSDRFITTYLRQTTFNPTFFLLMPGGVIDWGMFLGPPPELRTANDFYFEFRMGRAYFISHEHVAVWEGIKTVDMPASGETYQPGDWHPEDALIVCRGIRGPVENTTGFRPCSESVAVR